MDGRWRYFSLMLLVAAVSVGFAGCTNAGHTAGATAAAASAAAAQGSAAGLSTAAKLRRALLTRVNGVPAAAPASSGAYASLAGTGKQTSAAQVTPKVCAGTALDGFDPTAFAAAPAASVTFQVGKNGVTEVLIASSEESASAALARQVPAKCARYEEKVAGKTSAYTVKQELVTGIGKQARALNVAGASAAVNTWSLIYRGAGFVGSVTVTGPNASELAVHELGQQAYAFAAKSLS